ncbi:hypothetical protein GVN24_28560 [Rhizobium sp. CRIBSB]|nr:hypothetical protein [Rhizobium sp. CRIBSB]
MSESRISFAVDHPRDRDFFLAFVVVAVVAIAGGFLPRLETIFNGERPWPPLIVHVHAALFYGWIAFLAAQVLLVRGRATATHRRMGWLGTGLAAAMVGVGIVMSLHMAEWHLARGSTWQLGFLPIPLADVTAFGLFAAAAIVLRRDSPTHKRLILVATTVLLGAGFGRMNLYEMLPTPVLPVLKPMIDLYGMVWLVLAAAMLFDQLTRGRVHRAYTTALPILLAIEWTGVTLMTWPGWPDFARRVFDIG